MLIRNNKLHYRRRIPTALVHLFNRKEITKSLGTTDVRKATRLSNHYDGQVETLFHACRFNSITPESAQAQLKAIFTPGSTNLESQENQPTTITITAPSRRRGKRLADAIEAYSKEKEPSWSLKTKKEYTGIFDRILKGLNNPWLQDLERPTLVEYRDILSGEGKSVKTVNKYLQILSTVLNHANQLKWIQGNPAGGLGLKDNRRPDEVRRSFTSAEIKTIFAALQKDKQSFYEKNKHERYWLPLLGIFTGARVNELAQLDVNDIVIEDGIPALAITSIGDENKRLKNESSKRRIPLHNNLLTLGFLVYVNNIKQQGHSKLFPALKHGPNGYSHYFISQHFSGSKGWLRKQISNLDNGMSFHCFRHSFAEKLKDVEIAERLIEEIMGHKLTSQSMGRYAKPYKADVRIRAINQIQYELIPSVEEVTNYDPECEEELDYLVCGESSIRIDLEQGVTPIEQQQYQRPDLHGYSPFHSEIKSFTKD